MIDFLGIPLSLVNVSGWGAFSLLAWLLIRSIVKGELYPARVVEEMRKDRDQRLIEVGAWKAAWEERGKVVNELLSQNRELLLHTEVTTKILQSLPIPSGETGGPDSG